jgi:hypothetical protein
VKVISICVVAVLTVLALHMLAQTCIRSMGQHIINGCAKGEHIKFKLNDNITIKCEVVHGDD